MRPLHVVAQLSVVFVFASILSCAGFFLQPWTGDEQGTTQLLNEVDGLVHTLMRQNDVPGLSIAVVHEGRTLVLRGYGDADRENGVQVTSDTVFRAYSIAKVFTGLEVVGLAEEGLLDLDAPVASVVPEWRGVRYWEDSGQVTVRHLLAHRGGVPRNSNFHPTGGVPIEDVLRLQVESLEDAWAPFPAGERYKYSNAGYNVLGRAIEVARAELFAVYMSFTALPEYGMNRSAYFTGFLPPDAEIATGYVHERGRFRPAELYDLNELASGNLFTSAADMAAFMTTLLEATPGSGGPLSWESLQATYVPQFASATDPERTGLAWATSEELAGELMVWHQGGDADANALVALFPESRTGVCVLTNCGSYEGITLGMLAVDCLHAVHGHQPRAAPAAAVPARSASPATSRQTVGRYVAFGQLGELLTIKEESGQLKADVGPAELRMERAGESKMGTAYSLHHWLGGILSDALLPIDLDLVRIIVPPVEPGGSAPHVWLAVSDYGYERCPRYDAPLGTPPSWLAVEGEYDGCDVTVEDSTLHMSGVGYLREHTPDYYQVVGGPYDGETVTRDSATGSLSHQGFDYPRL
jgi:CubicO group peptidase (beta-lactamase class C family)